jgi:hypothetical protein
MKEQIGPGYFRLVFDGESAHFDSTAAEELVEKYFPRVRNRVGGPRGVGRVVNGHTIAAHTPFLYEPSGYKGNKEKP